MPQWDLEAVNQTGPSDDDSAISACSTEPHRNREEDIIPTVFSSLLLVIQTEHHIQDSVGPKPGGHGTHLECFHPLVVGAIHREENGLFAWRAAAAQEEGGAIKGLPDSHKAEGGLREHLLPLGLRRRRSHQHRVSSHSAYFTERMRSV